MEVLIIEDDIAISAIVAAVAERRGNTATICHTAEEGQNSWAEKKQPLIILDLHLPTMQGEDFCKWIREEEKNAGEEADTFILVSTSDSKVETFNKVLADGANDYIPKPLQPQLLAIRLGVAENQINQIQTKKDLQQENTKKEKRFRLISENSRDLVCTHKPDGEITYISPSCKNLLGFTPEELISKNFDNIKIDLEAITLNKNCGEVESNGQLESTSIWRTNHKTNGEVWLETYTQASKNNKNEIEEIYSYSRDITERIKEEKQLNILSVAGEETDSQTFLEQIIKTLEENLNAVACIHIHASGPDKFNYSLGGESISEVDEQIHKTINKTTDHEKALFQGKNADGVFNHINGIENIKSVIITPILGTFGKAIGKITITSKNPIQESERTKAILTLCASKIGCILEEHINRNF